LSTASEMARQRRQFKTGVGLKRDVETGPRRGCAPPHDEPLSGGLGEGLCARWGGAARQLGARERVRLARH
jgi:hypothetical protein